MSMAHDERHCAVLARILIARHGEAAHRIAADRVLDWARAGDDETAALWAEVVRLAATELASRTAPSEEPQLAERLDARLAAIAAGTAERDSFASLLAELRRRRRGAR